MSKALSCIVSERTETWWQQRHKSKLEEKASLGAAVDVVLLGDSLVHEWELEGELAWQAYFGEHKNYKRALNLGFAGDCTEHVLWRLQNGAINNINPQYVVIQVGTNNAGHRHEPPSDIAKGVALILQEVRKRAEHATIILMALFPRSRNPQKRMRIAVDKTNNLLAPLADNKRIIWLNINAQMLSPQGILETSVMPDLLHPNAAQYYKWAKALSDIMR